MGDSPCAGVGLNGVPCIPLGAVALTCGDAGCAGVGPAGVGCADGIGGGVVLTRDSSKSIFSISAHSSSTLLGSFFFKIDLLTGSSRTFQRIDHLYRSLLRTGQRHYLTGILALH